MDEQQIKDLDKLAQRLENSGVFEYVRLSQRTGRVLWFNFLSGIARGLGFTLGTAVVLAGLYKLLTHLISMNIPYLTEMLVDCIEFVKGVTPQ